MRTESEPASPVVEVKQTTLKWALILLPFAWLWFRLIDNLRLEWSTDPQYSYGLVVPLLMAGLLVRRWQRFSGVPLQYRELKNSTLFAVVAAGLAFLYFPTRLIEEAVPEWRPIGWLMAIETIVLTLYAIYLLVGWNGLKRFVFPFLFFFSAVPWPSLFEQPIIQHLSRLNAAMVVNVMGIFGIPAIQHGNVIEVSTGMVGINDACSGIRSLQSSLMISLFLGEYYFMRWPRRLFLVPAGFALAMFFNVCRTSLLTFLAAKDGIGAVSHYHDEAGITILFACTATLWAFCFFVSRWRNHSSPVTKAATDTPMKSEGMRSHSRALGVFAATLIVWFFVVETSIEIWYSIRESHIKPGPKWSLVLPTNNPTFKSLPFTPEEHTLLRFDDGCQGQWEGPNGMLWQAYYFDWLPGRIAGYLAKRHTPDICLPATGLTMVAGPVLSFLKVHDLDLPVRAYTFDGPDGRLQVFQCHWEPGADEEAYAHESSRFNLLRGVWTGRGDKGQKVFEIVITGSDNAQSAKQELARELEKLIKVEKSKA